jgi:hypothetical protein
MDYKLESNEAIKSLMELKMNLKAKKEATDLFAKSREKDLLE